MNIDNSEITEIVQVERITHFSQTYRRQYRRERYHRGCSGTGEEIRERREELVSPERIGPSVRRTRE